MITVTYRRLRSGKRRAAERIEQPTKMHQFATYEYTVERWHA